MSTEADAVVVGAGIAGLGAAHALRARGRDVLLLEAGQRPGGVMQSEGREGFLCEHGPNTFRIGPDFAALLRSTGLEASLQRAAPQSRERYLLTERGLESVPLGPLALLGGPLLSRAGKLRLLREPFVRRGTAEGESVAEFIARRFGGEVLERLLAPFLVGVYAGDVEQLGAEAVFPTLVEYERRTGSVTRGALAAALAGPFQSGAGRAQLRGRGGGGARLGGRGIARGLPGSFSFAGGLGALAAALAAALGRDVLRLQTPLRALAPEAGGGWRLQLDGEVLRSRQVVLALPAARCAELLRAAFPEASRHCQSVAHASLVSLSLDVDPRSTRRGLRGFGFLIPPGAMPGPMLGALFMSNLFPGRAPQGRALVTVFLGGVRAPGVLDEDDDALLAHAGAGLARALGTGDAPRLLCTKRWRGALPQPGREHPALVRGLRAELAAHPGLEVAGGWLDGVALGAALQSGAAAAARLCAAQAS